MEVVVWGAWPERVTKEGKESRKGNTCDFVYVLIMMMNADSDSKIDNDY